MRDVFATESEAKLEEKSSLSLSGSDPIERLEIAFERIAYRLHQQKLSKKTSADWEAVAANLDALKVRIDHVIKQVEEDGAS